MIVYGSVHGPWASWAWAKTVLNHGVDLGDFQAHNRFYQAKSYPLVI